MFFCCLYFHLKPRLDEIIIVSSAIVQKIEFYKSNQLPDESIPVTYSNFAIWGNF